MMDTDTAITHRVPEAADIVKRALEEAGIPESLHAGLTRYFLDGIRPGSFLCAVLENDLKEAVVRANPVENLLALPALVSFLYNEAPAPSWGDPATVAAWLAQRRADRA